jgi:hypothetical protein
MSSGVRGPPWLWRAPAPDGGGFMVGGGRSGDMTSLLATTASGASGTGEAGGGVARWLDDAARSPFRFDDEPPVNQFIPPMAKYYYLMLWTDGSMDKLGP